MPMFVTPREDVRFSAPSTSVRFNPWRPGLDRNGTDHAGGARDSTTSQDVAAASRASDGSWVAVSAPLDDRRPVGGASSYRAAAAVASIFSRRASWSPIRASHRRDHSASRDERHVSFACVASALKGPDRSAQGKATRVVRASPSPWVAYQRGKKALKGRDNRCIGLCRPFRAWGPIATATRGGATLCPGLICPGPFGATHRAPEDPQRCRHPSHRIPRTGEFRPCS